MSFGGNNSRNVANLLRFQYQKPIKPQVGPNEIPISDVFTPEENGNRRSHRQLTPLSSGGNKNQQLYPRSDYSDAQLESFKVRLDQVIKLYDQKHNNLQSKIMIRLNELENFVMKEVPKIDNSTMLNSDIIGCKQALKQIRKQQQYQLNELNTLKAISMNDKNTSIEVAGSNKEKQKMTVLFMEVVRLGDTIEKVHSGISHTVSNYENKITELQHKLVNSEKNLSILSERSFSGNDVLNQLGDKVMNRLKVAESNLLILGKQQVKDKETVGKLISQNQRIGQDMQALLRNMQNDFQSKLENRISQTVNRLVYEHEERIKAQEEIRKNLDLRQRLNSEKLMNDKIENKARYESMDALVRNEFLKKDESIRALHNNMQEQFRSISKQLQAEGGRKKQQQIQFRTEIHRVQQSLRKEYDLYKNHQSDLVEKITDMIKAEIQVRLTSELDLKKLTSDIANEIVTDLNNIKEALSSSNKKLNHSIKEVANQSSNRLGQVSHYIDEEVKKTVDVVTEKYSKMKNIFTKLAEQLRNHLVNTETNRKNVENRLTSVEEDFEKLKEQVNVEIDQFYNDLQTRLKEEKQFVQTVVFKKNNDLTIRVSKLQEYTNQYLQLLKNGLDENKSLLDKKMEQKQQRSPESEEEMKQLRTIVFNIKNITQAIKDDNNRTMTEIKKEMQQNTGKHKEAILDLEKDLTSKIVENQKKIRQMQQNIDELAVKVNGIRTQVNSDNPVSTDRLKKLRDEIDDTNTRVRKIQRESNESSNRNEEDVTRLRSEIAVLNGKIGALDSDIKRIGQL